MKILIISAFTHSVIILIDIIMIYAYLLDVGVSMSVLIIIDIVLLCVLYFIIVRFIFISFYFHILDVNEKIAKLMSYKIAVGMCNLMVSYLIMVILLIDYGSHLVLNYLDMVNTLKILILIYSLIYYLISKSKAAAYIINKFNKLELGINSLKLDMDLNKNANSKMVKIQIDNNATANANTKESFQIANNLLSLANENEGDSLLTEAIN